MNAVIYARYSSDNQREESIEGQLRECREYAERNDMTVVGTYIDRALSAKTADRPEFQRMIKDSAKKLFEIVLVWKLDRFSRNFAIISSLLKNRKYIGEYRYQDIVIEGGVPAIIPEDPFNHVQERMEKNRYAPAMAKADP